MPASRRSGGNSALSAAHFARNERPIKSTTAPTRATVLPPSSQAFAFASSSSKGLGFCAAMTRGTAAGNAPASAGAACGISTVIAVTGAVDAAAATAGTTSDADSATMGAAGDSDATVVEITLAGATAFFASRAVAPRATSLRTARRSDQPASAPNIAPSTNAVSSLPRASSTLPIAPQIAPHKIMSLPRLFACSQGDNTR